MILSEISAKRPFGWRGAFLLSVLFEKQALLYIKSIQPVCWVNQLQHDFDLIRFSQYFRFDEIQKLCELSFYLPLISASIAA